MERAADNDRAFVVGELKVVLDSLAYFSDHFAWVARYSVTSNDVTYRERSGTIENLSSMQEHKFFESNKLVLIVEFFT